MATDWNLFTIMDLRSELKRRGLSQAGIKVELISRLAESDEAAVDEVEVDGPDEVQTVETQYETSTAPVKPAEQVLIGKGTPKQDAQPAEQDSLTQNNLEQDAQHAPTNKRSKNESGLASLSQDCVPAVEPSEPCNERPADRLQAVEISTCRDKNQEAEMLDAPIAAADAASDLLSRKRRSRSPAPPFEVARKRVKVLDQDINYVDPEIGKLTKSETTVPAADVNPPTGSESRKGEPMASNSIPRDKAFNDSQVALAHGEEEPIDQVEKAPERRDCHDEGTTGNEATTKQKREIGHDDDPQDSRVAPARYPAASALYIKNLMRPIRELALENQLIDLATPLDAELDPHILIDFFLDPIRTHAFVRFSSVAAASRVRAALHGKIWPDEATRKELWVDFIPPEKVREWIELETVASGRGSLCRWEVEYVKDKDGNTMANLVVVGDGSAPARPPDRRSSTKSASGVHASALSNSIPTGPRVHTNLFPGVQGAPRGPRGGHGGRDNFTKEATSMTYARPTLQWTPVSEAMAQKRLGDMRQYFTIDLNRDMGLPSEINRYTFEHRTNFVNRGQEVFIGIRPPTRQAEVDRLRREAGGKRGRVTPAQPPIQPPALPPGSDRYLPGASSVPERNRGRDRDEGSGRGRDRNRNRSRNRERSRHRDKKDLDKRRNRSRSRSRSPRHYRDLRHVRIRHRDRSRGKDRAVDHDDNVPRSRFNGAPLPTYSGHGWRRRGGRRHRPV